MIRWVKVRERFAAAVAILALIAVMALAAALFGVNIPVLGDVTRALGLGP